MYVVCVVCYLACVRATHVTALPRDGIMISRSPKLSPSVSTPKQFSIDKSLTFVACGSGSDAYNQFIKYTHTHKVGLLGFLFEDSTVDSSGVRGGNGEGKWRKETRRDKRTRSTKAREPLWTITSSVIFSFSRNTMSPGAYSRDWGVVTDDITASNSDLD